MKETCPPMNQILLTTHPDNIMTKDINNPTPKNNAWKYEAKISAMKSYVQCELSTLHNKIERFMETFNKTISNFETKPYEILQDNIEFLQNELRSKDEIIKTLMDTQTAVLENLNTKRDSILAILIRILKSKTLSSFLASMKPHTCRKIMVLT